MPIFIFCWGICALLNACVKDFAGAVAVRFFLGMFEGLYGTSEQRAIVKVDFILMIFGRPLYCDILVHVLQER